MQVADVLRVIFFILIIASCVAADKHCIGRKYGSDSIVCVCNADYCDEISKIERLPPEEYLLYASNAAGWRFNKTTDKVLQFEPKQRELSWLEVLLLFWRSRKNAGNVKMKIDKSKRYQVINGFGGAFSDATGINLKRLSEGTSENVYKSYFSENGIEFNLGRVPIGGTDFSTHPYAYNMYPENDKILSNFSLTFEDFQYKIPSIKRARSLTTSPLNLIASTWSPPLWMKTARTWNGASALRNEFYQTYADYHVRFLEEYDKNGVNFWGITTTNEPVAGNLFFTTPNSLGWSPKNLAKWITVNFGPTIKSTKYSNLKILTTDDNINYMIDWLNVISENKTTWDYIDGIAAHYYADFLIKVDVVLKDIHNLFPEKFLLNTEASAGVMFFTVLQSPSLGDWNRAEYLMKELFHYLNGWSSGWIDWNLLVDEKGGPIWYGLPMDSFIIALASEDEILKQPSFYGIGHFSKFIPRGSVRIDVELLEGTMNNVAFLRPDGGIAVILQNPSTYSRNVTISGDVPGFIHFTVSPRSINSVIYWK